MAEKIIVINFKENKQLEREIERVIDFEIRPLFPEKKGKKWFRNTSETICRLTLQKARSQHYLNIDVSVIELNPPIISTEPVWHIIGRFHPNVEAKIEWKKCLNIRYVEVSGKPRQTRLVEILQQEIIPLLHSFETIDGIRRLLFSNQLRGMGI